MSLPNITSPASRGERKASSSTTPDGLAPLLQSLRVALGVTGRRRSRARRSALRRAGGDVAAVWEVITRMLLRFGAASSGNHVDVFGDGDDAFEAIWQAIDGAQRRVWYETYILEPDRVGTRTIEALTNAARRGCRVRLLYDAVGSPRAGEALIAPLRQAGAEIYRFNPLFRWHRKFPLLSRDHRKIMIVDDDTAFAGGMNTAEDYAGQRHGNGCFRDCHVRLRGPCARDIAAVHLDSLKHVTEERVPLDLEYAPRRGRTFVQALSSHGLRGRRPLQRAVRLTVRHSVRRCLITTPYFVPPQRLMNAIKHAASRGVEVTILTAGLSDVPVVRAAAQHIYGELLKRRVRIFELFGCTLHAKTMTIDGVYSTVGSFNLDTWSDKRNLEVNVGMVDAGVAAQLEKQFQANLTTSKEVTFDNWRKRTRWQRLVHWCAYQLMRL
jgi:cardiolipin synthase